MSAIEWTGSALIILFVYLSDHTALRQRTWAQIFCVFGSGCFAAVGIVSGLWGVGLTNALLCCLSLRNLYKIWRQL